MVEALSYAGHVRDIPKSILGLGFPKSWTLGFGVFGEAGSTSASSDFHDPAPDIGRQPAEALADLYMIACTSLTSLPCDIM